MTIPNKELFLEDKQKGLSYPGDMHDNDIKFHADINEYGKTPSQSIIEILAQAEPMISNEEWFKMGEQAQDLVKAVPEFAAGVGNVLKEDVKAVGNFLSFKKVDEEAGIEARRALVKPGLKIANSFIETLVRPYEMARVFIGDVVAKDTEDIIPDVTRAMLKPLETEKITEKVPIGEKELKAYQDIGTIALIPRALAMTIEDIIIYGGYKGIPKMIENYEINKTVNLVRNNTSKIHQAVMDKMNVSADEAWKIMERPDVQSFIYQRAQQEMKSTTKFYAGVPGPEDSQAAAKAVGEGLSKEATDPKTLAKAASKIIFPTPEQILGSKDKKITIQAIEFAELNKDNKIEAIRALEKEEQLVLKRSEELRMINERTDEEDLELLKTGQLKQFYKEVRDAYEGKLPGQKNPILPSVPPSPPKPPTTENIGPNDKPKPPYKTRGLVESIQEELPILKVSGQYIPRATDPLAIKANNLVKENLELAEQVAKGTDDKAVATAMELLKHYSDLIGKETNPAIKKALEDKASEFANEFAVKLTDLGRSVQAASILGHLTPEGQLRFAARTIQKYNEEIEKSTGLFGLKKKLPALTGQQASDILERMNVIKNMPDGEGKAIQWKSLQDYVSDLVPTPLWKKITTVWKAGLLTGLKTSGLNILSNAAHLATETLKDLPASAVDSVASLFTGKRSVVFTTKGLPGGGKEGFEKGWKFLKTGYDERRILEKLDYKRVNFGKGPVANGLKFYTEAVFRILGSEDQVFYYGAKARSIAQQAIFQAKNKGLKGKEAKEFIDNLIENPTDDMAVLSASDAETAVFQNKTVLSEIGSAIQKIPGGEFLLPFSKTPSAVAMQIVNYSPVGAVLTILRNIGKGKFNQRDFSQGIGRALLGVPLLWFGYDHFNKGNINLDRPKTEKEKELWKLEGRKPNTIRIGDKWRTFSSFGTAGNLMLIGGHFAKNMQESGSPTEAFSRATAGSLKSFTEQTFLKGVNSATEALNDPLRYGESFTSGLVSSFVPTIIADVAKATDKTERRTYGIATAVAARIPIIRQNLQPQIDVLGQERIIKENFLEIMADPTRPSKEIKEPIVQEIRRLVDSGYDISTTLLGDKEGFKILTPEQNTEIWQRAGSISYDKISSYMQMDNYDEVPDDIKAKNIDKILDKSKVIARVEKVLELTVDLEGDVLLNKLSEAKKDGLLNREVYEQYKKLR